MDWLETTPEFDALIVPGARLRVRHNPDSPHSELRHIRAIVDEEYVVYRVWWRHHKRWEYKIEWLYGFWIIYRHGGLTKA